MWLFGGQYRKIPYVRSVFRSIRVIKEFANLYHMLVILRCRKRWANKEVLIVFQKRQKWYYVCCFIFSVYLWFITNCGSLPGWSVFLRGFKLVHSRWKDIEFLDGCRLLYCCVVGKWDQLKGLWGLSWLCLTVLSPTSSYHSTVAIGDCNSPLTSINWNSDGAPSLNNVRGAS